jgi:hypothetical protein
MPTCAASADEARLAETGHAPHAEAHGVTGAVSPTGEQHPGTIVNEDTVGGTTRAHRASDVPQSIAWVKVHDRWIAVTRIVAVGTTARREIHQYAADGSLLQSTL